jgi:hypothetical protein
MVSFDLNTNTPLDPLSRGEALLTNSSLGSDHCSLFTENLNTENCY